MTKPHLKQVSKLESPLLGSLENRGFTIMSCSLQRNISFTSNLSSLMAALRFGYARMRDQVMLLFKNNIQPCTILLVNKSYTIAQVMVLSRK